MTSIDFSGHDTNKFIIDIKDTDVFITIGCSWSRAWGMTDDCQSFSSTDYRDDLNLFDHYSYAGKICQHLGYKSKIVMAIPGSNNDTQTRFLIELLQKNRQKFNRIFVLWGITGLMRWELYSNNISAPSMYMLGGKHPVGKEAEIKWHIVHHWNAEYELERLGQKIVTTSAYLNGLDIDHLFFPVFESYNNNIMNLNNVSHKNFFNIDDECNDMLHLWAGEQNIKLSSRILSNPYNDVECNLLKPLANLGYLSQRYAHPSIKGHADIANKLINYIDKTRN